MTRVSRTARSYLDLDYLEYYDDRENIEVVVSNKPRYSPVLDQYGIPYEYEEIKVGFR